MWDRGTSNVRMNASDKDLPVPDPASLMPFIFDLLRYLGVWLKNFKCTTLYLTCLIDDNCGRRLRFLSTMSQNKEENTPIFWVKQTKSRWCCTMNPCFPCQCRRGCRNSCWSTRLKSRIVYGKAANISYVAATAAKPHPAACALCYLNALRCGFPHGFAPLFKRRFYVII